MIQGEHKSIYNTAVCDPLKLSVVAHRWHCDNHMDLAKLECEIECEAPNNSLYTFTGNMHLGRQTMALNTNQASMDTTAWRHSC